MAKGKEKAPAPEEKETASGEAQESAPKKKGGKLKLIIIMVLGIIVVGGGGAFVGMKFLGGGAPAPVAEVAADGSAPPPPPPAEEGAPPIEDPAKAEGGHGGEAAEGGGGHGGGEGEGGEAPLEDLGPQNIEFKPFVVNLNDGAGRRFLKLTMSIEADTPALATEINQKTPQFRDTILLLLSSLSFDDIATLDGKMRLRNQMLNRINTQLTAGKIKNIYFSEFVVQ